MLNIVLQNSAGFTGWRLEKLQKAVEVFEIAVNSDTFKEKITSFKTPQLSYQVGRLWWKRTVNLLAHDSFVWNYTTLLDGSKNVMKNREIYAWIMLGQSMMESNPNAQIELDITLTNQRGVLGWTYPGTIKSWVSQWFFDDADVAELAGNLAHEAVHKLGFDHPFESTIDRNYTVPYAVGFIVRDIAKETLRLNKLALS